MDESDILETRQVIYVDEDNTTTVVDGEEIQYVIPYNVDKNCSMLVQEDGTSFTHYFLDANTNRDKSHIIIEKADYTDENDTSNNSPDESNQILQYNAQDVVAQVILSDEQCQIFQNFGRVVIEQGSKKFLLDGEGLKEVDSSCDLQNLDCILTNEDGACNETTDDIVNSDETRGQESKSASNDELEKEHNNMEEYIVPEDNKESVFEFLKERCDVIMDGSETISIEAADQIAQKSSETFFDGNLSIINRLEEYIQCENPSDNQNESCKKNSDGEAKSFLISSQSKLVSENVTFLKSKLSNKFSLYNRQIAKNNSSRMRLEKKDNFILQGFKKDFVSQIKAKSQTQIRDGKIVMMPEDANSPYAKRLIKTHFSKCKKPAEKITPKFQVIKNKYIGETKPNKLSLKHLKDFKIYIGTTGDGKNIYGKIIDIVKPGSENNKSKTEKNEKNIIAINKNLDYRKNSLAKDKNKIGKDLEVGNDINPVDQSASGSNHLFDTNMISPTDLNRVISEKETNQSLLVSKNCMDLSQIMVDNDGTNIYTIGGASKINNLKFTSIPLAPQVTKSKFIVPTEDELENLDEIFSKMTKSPKTATSLVSRDILIIKGTENGESEMFTGRVEVVDKDDNTWKFNYMPELWDNVEGSDINNVLKDGNFFILKLVKNYLSDTTDIIIMDKVKCATPLAKTVDNSTKSIRKTMLCSFCKKPFYRLSCLTRHMSIHTSQKAVHKCTYCSCVFRYLSTLTRHLVEQHPGATNPKTPISVSSENSSNYKSIHCDNMSPSLKC